MQPLAFLNSSKSMFSLIVAIPAWKLLRSLGGVGLVLPGIVDSSAIPAFGSLDALTAILSVKNQELWPYYPAASTAGSLFGTDITCRMSERAGERALARKAHRDETLSTGLGPT